MKGLFAAEWSEATVACGGPEEDTLTLSDRRDLKSPQQPRPRRDQDEDRGGDAVEEEDEDKTASCSPGWPTTSGS